MKPQDATDAEALRLTQAHEVGWAEDYRAAMERAAVIADEYVAEQGRTRGLVNNYHAKGGIACAAAIRAEAAKEAK